MEYHVLFIKEVDDPAVLTHDPFIKMDPIFLKFRTFFDE